MYLKPPVRRPDGEEHYLTEVLFDEADTDFVFVKQVAADLPG